MSMLTPECERALHLLKELTPIWVKKNRKRTTNLLVSPDPDTPCTRYPDPWCNTWAYLMGSHHGDALDVQLLSRRVKKQSFLEWSQGSCFHFKDGYVVYTPDGMALQVIESQPTESAKVEKLDYWPIEFPPDAEEITLRINEYRANGSDAFLSQRSSPEGKMWVLCRMVKRDPGFLKATVYRPKDGAYCMEAIDSIITSQDQFIKTLIVGLAKS